VLLLLVHSTLATQRLLTVRRAITDNAPQVSGVIQGILRRAPYARNAEFSAATFRLFIRAIHLSPGVAHSAALYAPATPLGMGQRGLYLFLCMGSTNHPDLQSSTRDAGCQVTTYVRLIRLKRFTYFVIRNT
jgi:hypothetical protein